MLKCIDVKNFRSCYNTSIKFDESVCALVGKNGVGKTNVLKCIDWIASSSISTDPIRVSEAGNNSDELDEVTVNILTQLDGKEFDYNIVIPFPYASLTKKTLGLRDGLTIRGDGEGKAEIFRRDGDKISLFERIEPIRIPRSTPSIAALLSLLPENDPFRAPLTSLTAFFAGVRYYALEERAEYRDFVTEQQFNDWLIKYKNEGILTNSVALRLIYMWSEARELFEELRSLLGPDGLGLLEQFDVLELNKSTQPPLFKNGDNPKAKIYMPVFIPSAQMGGAGRSFPFSDLSIGTRRIIRIVTSLIFDKRSLMLMEQPEDSVHPGLLRKLIDLLRSYSDRSQILLTTHSSAILDILSPEEVLMATARDGRTTVRDLSPDEISRAKRFLDNEGTLSDFLEPFDEQ